MNPPESIEEWFKTIKYSNETITVFRLHEMIDINEIDQNAFYNDLKRHLTKEERKESEEHLIWIKNENCISELLSIYDNDKHKELVREIVSRIIQLDNCIYKKFLEKLKVKYTENEFDNVIHILVETIKTKDISEELLEVLSSDYVRDPQDFAVLIQILGLCSNDTFSYLYTFYNYFKNNFPEENYYEGPLLGISYYIERRRRTIAST